MTSVSAWTLVVHSPRERPIGCVRAPFSAEGRALRLDVGAVDRGAPRHRAGILQRIEQLEPEAPSRPTIEAVVDRRCGAVIGRTVDPPAATLEHVKAARDHPAIIVGSPNSSGVCSSTTRFPAHAICNWRVTPCSDLLPMCSPASGAAGRRSVALTLPTDKFDRRPESRSNGPRLSQFCICAGQFR